MKSFFTIPKPLGISVIISTVIYLITNLILNNYEEWFNGGYEIGVVISSICLSIISGYFFYVIVNQLKIDKEKKNLHDFISCRIENIISSTGSFYSEAVEKTKYFTSIPPEKKEINELLKLIETNPELKPSLSQQYSKRNPWFELMIYEKAKTEKQIEILLKISNNLDSELLKILGQLVDSKYFFWIDETKNVIGDFQQFSMWGDRFHEYTLIAIDLLRYAYKGGFVKREPEDERKLLKRIANGKKISVKEITDLRKTKGYL